MTVRKKLRKKKKIRKGRVFKRRTRKPIKHPAEIAEDFSRDNRGGQKYYSFPMGTTEVRLLPRWETESGEEDPFKKLLLHYGFEMTTQWGPRKIAIPCLTYHTQNKSKCPVCQVLAWLKDNEDQDPEGFKKLSERLRPAKRFLFNAMIKNRKLGDPIKIINVPFGVAEKVVGFFKKPGYGDVTDEIEGWNLYIEKSGEGGFNTRWAVDPVPESKGPITDPDWEDKLHDLDAELNTPSRREAIELLDENYPSLPISEICGSPKKEKRMARTKKKATKKTARTSTARKKKATKKTAKRGRKAFEPPKDEEGYYLVYVHDPDNPEDIELNGWVDFTDMDGDMYDIDVVPPKNWIQKCANKTPDEWPEDIQERLGINPDDYEVEGGEEEDDDEEEYDEEYDEEEDDDDEEEYDEEEDDDEDDEEEEDDDDGAKREYSCEQDEKGNWIDPDTGDVLVWDEDDGEWWNELTGVVYDDLPAPEEEEEDDEEEDEDGEDIEGDWDDVEEDDDEEEEDDEEKEPEPPKRRKKTAKKKVSKKTRGKRSTR